MQESQKPKPPKLSFSDRLRLIWRALSGHLWMKIFSVFLAILIWGFVISSDSTLTRKKAFTDVEVTVSGADSLRQQGYIVMEDVSALVPTVNFTAEVPQNAFDRATGSSFGPRIDLTRIRAEGEQEVFVSMTSSALGTVTKIEPASVMVAVERYAPRSRVPIVVELTGELQEGLWADTPRSDPALVTVSGPESLIRQIIRGEAKLDASLLTGRAQVERNAIDFVLVNDLGEPLDASLLTVTYEGVVIDSIVAEVSTYSTRDLPVDTASAVTGELADGYTLEEVVIEPDSVEVAASQSALSELTQVFVETPLDLSGLTHTASASSKLKKITDAKHMGVEEVVITARITEETLTRIFRKVPVQVSNLDETTQKARLSASTVDVSVTGPYHAVMDLDPAQILVWADAADWREDSPEVPLRCEVDGSDSLEATTHPDSIRLTISPL